ncbi:hypothetical protein ACFE04_018792 [Oxalis oulophora]
MNSAIGGIVSEGCELGHLEVKPSPYNVLLEDDTYKGQVKIGFKFITRTKEDFVEIERFGGQDNYESKQSFEDETFDVVLDKCGLDALMEPELGPILGNQYLLEVSLLLYNDSGGLADAKRRIGEESVYKSRIWKLTEINEPSQCHSPRLADNLAPNRIFRLIYTNSALAALASNASSDTNIFSPIIDIETVHLNGIQIVIRAQASEVAADSGNTVSNVLKEYIVQDLNQNPYLPFEDNTFDVIINVIIGDFS